MAPPADLVEPAALEPRLNDPGLRVIDASWYLPAAGRDPVAEYAAGHVPGAVRLDLSTDLAEAHAPVRNTSASAAELARVFGEAGIGTNHEVVVYDRLGGFSAGRVWWALCYAGHSRVALLDGGLVRWVAEGRPLSTERPQHRPAVFEATPRLELLATKSDVLQILKDGSAQIVDARSAERFRGEGEEHARHCGHVPGAVSVPYAANLTGDPRVFRTRAELRSVYEAAGVRFDRPIVAMCGSGVSASLDAFALTLLGHAAVRVYDGSWAEWGNSDDVPIETGG